MGFLANWVEMIADNFAYPLGNGDSAVSKARDERRISLVRKELLAGRIDRLHTHLNLKNAPSERRP